MKTVIKIFFLIWIVVSDLSNANAQEPVTWQKVLDYTDVCTLYKTIQTSDGGYISTGRNRINIYPRLILIKFNEYGDTLWNKYFDMQNIGGWSGFWVEETHDKGFIVCGDGEGIDGEALLLKTDSMGNNQWYKTYAGNARAHCVRQLQDKGYIVLISTYMYGPVLHISVIRTDSLGNIVWTKKFGNDHYGEYGNEIRITGNSGFIITGMVRPGHENLFLLKLNNNGDSLWYRTYTEYLSSEGFSVDNTDDGGFIVGGTCDSLDDNNKKSYILKTDSLGIVQWSRKYATNFNEWCYCARNAGNSKYVMCGTSDSTYTGFERAFVRLIDAKGIVLSEKFYRGGGGVEISNAFYSVENTFDNGFILSGYTYIGTGMGFVVKTDSLLNVIPVGIKENEKTVKSFELYQNFPNPFNSQTIIKYNLHKPGFVEFKIYDISGKEILSDINKHIEAGEKEYIIRFDNNNLSSGIYFYKMIFNKNQSLTKKFVHLK